MRIFLKAKKIINRKKREGESEGGTERGKKHFMECSHYPDSISSYYFQASENGRNLSPLPQLLTVPERPYCNHY